jgi:hypothetical protein
LGNGINDVLAAIEHNQHLFMLQESDEPGHRAFGTDWNAEPAASKTRRMA